MSTERNWKMRTFPSDRSARLDQTRQKTDKSPTSSTLGQVSSRLSDHADEIAMHRR